MSTTDSFTSSSTWTCPAYVTTVWPRCWAGGGAGGGVNVTPSTTSAAGGGGAGGSFSEKLAYPVTPGNVYTVTVGATRTGSTGNGGAGNDSWFDNNTTGILAKGGAGGQAPPNGFGSSGIGGSGSTTGCVGDNKFAGGSGASALADSTTFVGGGGGGAGSAANGSSASGTSGGGGGSAQGGAGGNGRTTAGAGNAGATYGGGGSGAFGTVASHSFAGGNGAAGRVELEYTPTFSSSGSGVRAVADTSVDISSAPAAIGGLTPVSGDVFLLLGPGTTGLFSWTSAGTAMTLVSDTDGTYRDVREGAYAGARVFTTLASDPLLDPSDSILPTGNVFLVNPLSGWVTRGGTGPEGYVGVCPTTSSGASWVVPHHLGSKFLLVTIAATASPFGLVRIGPADWVVERTDLNNVTVKPPLNITAGDYEVMIRKAV